MQVIVYQLGKTQEHRLWMPLVPAQFRITMPFWAPAVDFLLSVLLPGQVRNRMNMQNLVQGVL